MSSSSFTPTYAQNLNDASPTQSGIVNTGAQVFAGAKTFNSTITGSITGNAGTVTNGVYTSGDQTIGGTKTFSSTISGSITGNAGTVTNGVYTTGAQNISGTKTFVDGLSIGASGSSGQVYSGTYTPSATNVANCDAFSYVTCYFFRIHNAVTVWGFLNVDVTTGGALTQFNMSLPIVPPSNFSANEKLSGFAGIERAGEYQKMGLVFANTSGQVAFFTFNEAQTTSATSKRVFFNFSYVLN